MRSLSRSSHDRVSVLLLLILLLLLLVFIAVLKASTTKQLPLIRANLIDLAIFIIAFNEILHKGCSCPIKSRIYKASASSFLKSWRRITNFLPPLSLSLSVLLLGASHVAYLIELITSKFVSYISARLRESFRGAGESRTGNWEQVTGLGQQVTGNWQAAALATLATALAHE